MIQSDGKRLPARRGRDKGRAPLQKRELRLLFAQHLLNLKAHGDERLLVAPRESPTRTRVDQRRDREDVAVERQNAKLPDEEHEEL